MPLMIDLGCIYSLLASVCFHMFGCVSQGVSERLLIIDFSGIGIYLELSSFALAYYLFYCDTSVLIFWETVIGILFPVMASIPFLSVMHRRRTLRSGIFMMAGLIPTYLYLHYIFLHGTGNQIAKSYLYHLIVALIQLAFAVFFFLSRIPERFWPGKFDYFLMSHSSWHLLTAMSYMTLRSGANELRDMRLDDRSCQM